MEPTKYAPDDPNHPVRLAMEADTADVFLALGRKLSDLNKDQRRRIIAGLAHFFGALDR
jgi:hypothetical protein